MKKIILSLSFLVIINIVNAQYRDYKDNYDRKTYSYTETDRYNPSVAGMWAIFPGVGHFYSNEPLRGLAFLGGMAGCAVAVPLGFVTAWNSNSGVGGFMMVGGAVGFVVIYIWNFIDAVNVAKVKNLAIRDKAISFDISPHFELETKNKLHSKNLGLSLKMSF